MNKTIGIIGVGYWGNIVLKTLIKMGYTNIIICEKDKKKINNLLENFAVKFKVVKDYQKLVPLVDCVFCLTPASTHFTIVKFFLQKNIPVFCEKPLCLDKKEIQELYKSKTPLFVDWIFNYNEHFNYIKKLIPTIGKLRSIEFNRLNFGPIRKDVNALIDLSSHDISMICSMYKIDRKKVKIFNYRMNNLSIQDDSNIVFIDGVVKILIKSSWEYNYKNRNVIFNFDNDVLVWDDAAQKITLNGKDLSFTALNTPLVNSINSFFELNNSELEFNKKITENVSEIIL
jgi:predicted dehydrogenase